MDLELLGKAAVVTGGSRGIGKAIARELAMEGVDVAIAARNPARLEAAAREIAEDTGRLIVPITVDTGDDDSVIQMVRIAARELGHIDILINNAAQPGSVLPSARLGEITGDHFWPDMNTKVMGYLRCAREAAPHMLQGGWGRIINIGGLAARQSGNTIGSMRNVAVVAMAKNLADELGPKGINVTVVHPGAVRTERTGMNIQTQARLLGITPEEIERRIRESNSVRRIIDSTELAYIVAFLASPKSIAINGDVIAAGGGIPRGIHY